MHDQPAPAFAQKARLVEVLRERSVRWGEFTLASGKSSDLYVDARLTTLSPEGAALIAEAILESLPENVAAIGGPVTGADPIVGAVVAGAHRQDRALFGFMVRKQPKGHGTKQWVEGRANLQAGDRVVVVEDTVTTGGSLLRAVEKVEETGLVVDHCIVVVDREEGAAERIAAAGHRMVALVRRRDLVDG